MRKGYSFTVTKEVIEQMTFEREEDDWAMMVASQGEKVKGITLDIYDR